MKTLNKEKLLAYLKANKDLLNISAIGRESGVSNLNQIITGAKDGKGYPFTLSDKHVEPLLKIINRLNIR